MLKKIRWRFECLLDKEEFSCRNSLIAKSIDKKEHISLPSALVQALCEGGRRSQCYIASLDLVCQTCSMCFCRCCVTQSKSVITRFIKLSGNFSINSCQFHLQWGAHRTPQGSVSACRLLRAKVGQEGTVRCQPKASRKLNLLLVSLLKVKYFSEN